MFDPAFVHIALRHLRFLIPSCHKGHFSTTDGDHPRSSKAVSPDNLIAYNYYK